MEGLLKKIQDLENENQQLKKWQADMNSLCSEMIKLLEKHEKEIRETTEQQDQLWRFATINRWRVDSLPYEMSDPDFQLPTFKPDIISAEETRKLITEKNYSIARFGDCEIAAIDKKQRWNYQNASEYLSKRLLEVLQSKEEGLLIGLNPMFYRSLFDLPELDADGVRAYMNPTIRKRHAELLDPEKQYADALFHNMYSDEDVSAVQKIWDNRDILLIEGKHTGSGVGNDLFCNCHSVRRILCPAENAVDVYEDILQVALQQPKEKIVLIALGPTATVMAYDLHKAGYQALDIGHVDLIYEKYRRGESDLYKVKIPYKYCSADERNAGREIEEITDPEYLKQIIARVGI